MLFSGEHTPACATCRRASPALTASDQLLCRGKTLLSPDHSCRRYQYDPLKRQPPPPPELAGNYSPEDFIL